MSISGRRRWRSIVDAAPDVVLIDDMDSTATARSWISSARSRARARGIAVIVLTMAMDAEWLEAVFAAGAVATISKAAHPMALATLVRETVSGHVLYRHRQSGGPSQTATGHGAGDDSALTARELEVLRLVAAGATNGEIARSLWVTEQTVKFHLSNVYRKLDVGNRTEASHYAHVNGLLGEARPVGVS